MIPQPPTYSIEIRNGFISVVSEGIYTSFSDLMAITASIHKKAEDSGLRHFLLDFTRSYFKLPLVEAYNLIRTYDLLMPACADGVAACAFHESSFKFIEYWHDVGNQRGYEIQLFKDNSDAAIWLQNKIDSAQSG